MIEKIIKVEALEVEKNKKIQKTLNPYLFTEKELSKPLVGTKRLHKTIDDPSSESDIEESENSDNEEGLEIVNKPVSSLNKLTKTERNAKMQRRQKHLN